MAVNVHSLGLPVTSASVVAVMLQLSACGGTTTSTSHDAGSPAGGGAAGQVDSGSSAGAGGSGNVGGCASTLIGSDWSPPCTSDADCFSPTAHCRDMVPGGYRTCLEDPVVSTFCNSSGGDQCGCDGGACPFGSECYAVDPGSAGTSPGGQDANTCIGACDDAQCEPGSACVVGGSVKCGNGSACEGKSMAVATCQPVTCRVDADCRGCGRCAPYWWEIAPGAGDSDPSFDGLRCTCLSDSDCSPPDTCQGPKGWDLLIQTRYCFPPGH